MQLGYIKQDKVNEMLLKGFKAYLLWIPVREEELQHISELPYFNIQYFTLGRRILNDWQNK